MNLFKVFLCSVSLVLLSACSSSGPMKSIHGPVNTSLFETILNEQIISEEEVLILARKGETPGRIMGVSGGAVILTDKRFIFAEWKVDGFRYFVKDSYEYNEIDFVNKAEGLLQLMLSTPAMAGLSFVLKIGEKEFQYSSESVELVIKEINKRLVPSESKRAL